MSAKCQVPTFPVRIVSLAGTAIMSTLDNDLMRAANQSWTWRMSRCDERFIARLGGDRPAEAANLLARFPGPIVLHPSRCTYVALMAGGAIFVGVGAGDIALGHPVIGWFLVMFFGLGAILFAAFILPGANALKLDHEGFELTVWYRRGKVRWQDATGFTLIPASLTSTIVVFNLAGRKSRKTGAFLNRAFAQGRNASLPDTYGLRSPDLADLLTRWRERALHTG